MQGADQIIRECLWRELDLNKATETLKIVPRITLKMYNPMKSLKRSQRMSGSEWDVPQDFKTWNQLSTGSDVRK